MVSVFILASGPPKPTLPISYEKPIPLIELCKNYTILDHQMDMLHKHGFEDRNIWIILGVFPHQVLDYCKNKNYQINILIDKEFEKHNTIPKGLLAYIGLLTVSAPTIILFCDQLFSDEAIRNIINCNADFCRLSGTHGIHKYSRKALNILYGILSKYDSIDEVCAKLREYVSYSYVGGWWMDIDNTEHLQEARQIWLRKNV